MKYLFVSTIATWIFFCTKVPQTARRALANYLAKRNPAAKQMNFFLIVLSSDKF